MIGEIISKLDLDESLLLVNGTILKAYMLEDIEIGTKIAVSLLPFITSKVNRESFSSLNKNKDKKLVIDDFKKSSYQAFGEILNTSPLTIDCGSVILELDEQDLHSEIKLSELEQGNYVYFYIDRLDIEIA